MKTTITIEVEKDLLNQAQGFAKQHKLSISELVELYFKNLSKRTAGKTVIELIKELKKPALDESTDLKTLGYDEQKAKYGF